jgi:hypothetical protein
MDDIIWSLFSLLSTRGIEPLRWSFFTCLFLKGGGGGYTVLRKKLLLTEVLFVGFSNVHVVSRGTCNFGGIKSFG